MANILNHLAEQGLVVKRDSHWTLDATLKKLELTVPPTIRQIIDRQLERCTPQEQDLLQAASVKGMEFSVAIVAAALNEKEDEIELLCRNLAASNRFLQPAPQYTALRGEKGRLLSVRTCALPEHMLPAYSFGTSQPNFTGPSLNSLKKPKSGIRRNCMPSWRCTSTRDGTTFVPPSII